jgi:hypothetical protein
VPASIEEDELVDSRQVFLVLRLVLNPQARLHHGELLDAEAICQGRFMTLSGLTELVAHWLERQPGDSPNIDPPASMGRRDSPRR